jgi:preprotein translocase subunit SecE
MNMAKDIQNKDKDASDQSDRTQKLKATKKTGQQPSGKKSEVPKKSAKKSDETRSPWWERIQQYLREVSYELRKVVWPSRKETIGTTSVVLIIVIICGVYLGFLDYLLSLLVGRLLG